MTAAGTALAWGPGGFEPRHVDTRRYLYRPKWDARTILAGDRQDVSFFTNRSPNRWVTNLNQAGTVNVYESFVLSRVLFSPLFGTDETDMIECLNDGLIEIQIQNDRAYELLLFFQQPGNGIQGGSQASHGAPITGYATDLGQVIIGGGIDFSVTLKWPNPILATSEDIVMRCQLETMADVVVG